MLRFSLFSFLMVLANGFGLIASVTVAQDTGKEPKPDIDTAQIVTMTTREDHREMQDQLGIKKLRPGPSGNESAPNHANYDESLANPYPNLPDLMTLGEGTSVSTAAMWWKQRRPEIVEEFEREIVGRIPKGVPKVTWTVVGTEEKTLGETVVIQKQLNGNVSNSACPEIEVNISMVVVTPKEASGKVPVLMMFGSTGFEPGSRRRRSGRRPGSEPPKTQQLVELGWGYATISPRTIQADNGAGLTRGIIGLTNRGQPRKPDDWGSLRAWAWGASRGLDYLESDADIDATRVGIDGVSRYGKAALVTMAFDQRFAMALIGSSGEGGAALYRRNFGEAVENLTGSGEYHWMAGNFLKYGAEDSSFGSKTADDLPVDAHQLIALCAPRLTFISYGIPERGDALWLDQQGSYMATVAAQPAFRLLGAGDLGVSDDYKTETMPAVNIDLLDGELAWRQHDGGHTDLPNIKHFVKWADRMVAEPPSNADQLDADELDADGLLDPDRLIEVKIEMPEADWNSLRNQSRNPAAFFSGAAIDNPYTYFQADVWINDQKIESVGIRKKGLFGSQDNRRPSLKIKFDKFVEQNPIKGLSRLTLNNNKQDTSLVSQYLSYKLFRDAGVHAPRCNLARVTVNGDYLGIYSNVESIKPPFLRQSFGDDSGNLYETTLTDFYPGAVDKIEAKTNKKNNQREVIRRLAELLKDKDAAGVDEIGEIVDLDNFYRYWAMEGLIRFWDGHASNQNNYYVYFDPRDDKAYFIPWGADGSFSAQGGPFGGGFGRGGRSKPTNTSVYAQSFLAHRLYRSKGGEERYKAALKNLLDEVWDEDALTEELDRMVDLYRPYLGNSQQRAVQAANDVKTFIRTRRTNVTKELANWTPVIPTEPKKPMYSITVGTVQGSFEAKWADRAPAKIEEVGDVKIEMRVDDADIAFKRMGVSAQTFQFPRFGGGFGGGGGGGGFGGGGFGGAGGPGGAPEFVPPVNLVFRGLRKSDGKTVTVTLSIDRDSFKKTGESVAVTGSFSMGGGGFNGGGFGGGFGGGNRRSVTGTMTLTESGGEVGDRIAGEVELNIVEVRGGLFNRGPAGGMGPPGAGGPFGGGGRIPPSGTSVMQLLDRNRDGKISATELENAERVLKRLDQDRDGELTEDELRAGRR